MSSLGVPMIINKFEGNIHSAKKQNSIKMSTSIDNEQLIKIQKDKVAFDNPKLNIVSPCKIGNGILQLTTEEWRKYQKDIQTTEASIGVFIPASGSGSRMFEFLFDFLNNPTEYNRSAVERFLNQLPKFAFFQYLPKNLQSKLLNFEISLEDFVAFLLDDKGMGFGELPKGLIPFHIQDPFVLNAIQEHIVQSNLLNADILLFHFTIQRKFEDNFKTTIKQIEGLTGNQFNVSYSEQAVETDSFVFDINGELVLDEHGNALRRPAGHGALIGNLQQLNSELIFVKNIDNVQHYSKSKKSIELWSALGSLLLSFRKKLMELKKAPSIDKLKQINDNFQVYTPSEIDSVNTETDILKLINRPIRVCGMVRNEGQPGGGPFLVEDENGVISKQIVEKAQISLIGEQYKQMIQSTHFNPVMMALCIFDLDGIKFNLLDFRDESKYFIVSKKQKGKEVRFVELPGLWNGGMANWNTIFIEVPNETFSPVKTILDLLNEPHLAKE
jgi:hypothetical protein